MEQQEKIRKIAESLSNRKGQEILAIDVSGLTSFTDCFVIANGDSVNQTHALADEVEEQLAKEGVRPKRVEGYREGSWILMDYEDVMVQIFHKNQREFYGLERLWADGEKIDLSFLDPKEEK